LAWAAAGDAASFGMSLVRNTARAAAEGETGAGLDASAADGGTAATAWTSRALLHHERRRVLATPDCDRSVKQNPNPPPPCCQALGAGSSSWRACLGFVGVAGHDDEEASRYRVQGGRWVRVEVALSSPVARASTGRAWLQKNGSQERRTGAKREGVLVRWSLVEEQWKEIKHRLPACGELEPLNWPISNTP